MSDKIGGYGSNKISIIWESDKDNKQTMLNLYQLGMLQHSQKKRTKQISAAKLVDGVILTCPGPDGLIDRPDNRKNGHKCELKLI
jgi:hypothetical protein